MGSAAGSIDVRPVRRTRVRARPVANELRSAGSAGASVLAGPADAVTSRNHWSMSTACSSGFWPTQRHHRRQEGGIRLPAVGRHHHDALASGRARMVDRDRQQLGDELVGGQHRVVVAVERGGEAGVGRRHLHRQRVTLDVDVHHRRGCVGGGGAGGREQRPGGHHETPHAEVAEHGHRRARRRCGPSPTSCGRSSPRAGRRPVRLPLRSAAWSSSSAKPARTTAAGSMPTYGEARTWRASMADADGRAELGVGGQPGAGQPVDQLRPRHDGGGGRLVPASTDVTVWSRVRPGRR